MLDFSKITPANNITKEFLLRRISPEQIFAYYCIGFKAIGKKFLSPLRKEKSPSAEIKYSRNGWLYFTDWAGKKGLDCFSFVQEYYSLDFRAAVQKIACDFGFADCNVKVDYERLKWVDEIERGIKIDTTIQFELLDWPQNYLDYWKKYHIVREELEVDKDCFSIGKAFITSDNNPKGMWVNNYGNKPKFVYVMKNPENITEVKFKIYTPGSKFKWLSNCPNNWPFGYYSLPYQSETLIISKSYKDMKTIRKTHPDTCATQNESIEALKYLISLVKDRYKRILLWYDADETGLRIAAEALELGLVDGTMTIPLYMAPEIKDPSDFDEYYGPEQTKKLILKNLQ